MFEFHSGKIMECLLIYVKVDQLGEPPWQRENDVECWWWWNREDERFTY